MSKSVKGYFRFLATFYKTLLDPASRFLQLEKPSVPTPKADNEPTTLSDRGTRIPWLMGRRRVGSVFAWAGDRKSTNVDGALKYRESGWHQLGIWQGYGAIRRIWRRGELIFEGLITSKTHPSGSVVDLGDKHGSFAIFWGEPTQPVNTFLAAPSRLGIASRWRNACYVLWDPFKLGFSPVWDELEYDLELRPEATGLTKTEPYIPSTKVLAGTTYDVKSTKDGPAGEAEVVLVGKHAEDFEAGWPFLLAGNGAPDGEYVVKSATDHSSPARTVIVLDQELSGGNSSGHVQPYKRPFDDGVNPAHMLWTILFAPWPRGLGKDPEASDVDVSSLEDLGLVLEAEHLGCALIGQQGKSFADLIGTILVEVGAVWARDPKTGKLRFEAVRDSSDPLPVIPLDAMGGSPPEVKAMLIAPPVSNMLYAFQDRRRSYADSTLALADDGLATQQRLVGADSDYLSLPTDFDTAARIAQRREQERPMQAATVRCRVGRGARELVAGRRFLLEGVAFPMRLASNQPQQLSSACELVALHDVYGVPPSTYAPPDGSLGDPTFDDPDEDLAFAFVEVPPQLIGGSSAPRVFLLRVRAHAQVVGADALVSPDDSSYGKSNGSIAEVGGAQLLEGFAAGGPGLLETGPTFVALGPDLLDHVQDLSADEVSWTSGKFVAWCDGEWMFPRQVVPLGGNVYRLDGVLRARYWSDATAHPAGSIVYLFDSSKLAKLTAAFFAPGVEVFGKSIPATTSSVDPEDVLAQVLVLYGMGLVPRAPGPIISETLSGTWLAGEDLSFFWGWSTGAPGVGAGAFPAGSVTPTPPVQGTFTVVFRDELGDVKRTVTGLTAASYDYASATLIADFGGSEPDAIIVEVVHLLNGWQSGVGTTTFTKL